MTKMTWMMRTQVDMTSMMVTLVTWLLCLASLTRAISDTWSMGDIMGRLDSRGSLAYWRDLSTSVEIPDPSDDFDRIILNIDGLNLIKPDQNRINLLESTGSDPFQPDVCDRILKDVSGSGKCLRANPASLGSSLSVFLFIFSSSGKVFKDSPLEEDIHPKDACIGVEFPTLVNVSTSHDLCGTGRCRLELLLTVQGQMVSRTMRDVQTSNENMAMFDLRMGLSTMLTLTNKV